MLIINYILSSSETFHDIFYNQKKNQDFALCKHWIFQPINFADCYLIQSDTLLWFENLNSCLQSLENNDHIVFVTNSTNIKIGPTCNTYVIDNILYPWDIWHSSPIIWTNLSSSFDLRMNHPQQLKGLLEVIKQFPEVSRSPTSLKKIKYHFKLCIVMYLVPKSKFKKLFEKGVFNSNIRIVFVPLFFNRLSDQYKSLSVAPDVFLSKVSDYLATIYNPCHQQLLLDLYKLEKKLIKSNVLVPAKLQIQRNFIDRYAFTIKLNKVSKTYNSHKRKQHLYIPRYWYITDYLDSSKLEGIQYPVVCKLQIGGGSKNAHFVGLCMSETGIHEFCAHFDIFKTSKIDYTDRIIEELYTRSGLLIQEYMDSGDHPVLKIFVCYDRCYIGTQISIPHPTDKCTEFLQFTRKNIFTTALSNQQQCYIFNTSCFKNEFNEIIHVIDLSDDSSIEISAQAFNATTFNIRDDLKEICKLLQNEFQTHFFGFDVINYKEKIIIVDINYFPSYAGVDKIQNQFERYYSSQI